MVTSDSSTITILSAEFFHRRYQHQSLQSLANIWYTKRNGWLHLESSETERAINWQSMLALRKIFQQRGYWNHSEKRPMHPEHDNLEFID